MTPPSSAAYAVHPQLRTHSDLELWSGLILSSLHRNSLSRGSLG